MKPPAYRTAAGFAALMDWYGRQLARFTTPVRSLDLLTRYGYTHVIASGPAGAVPVLLLHGINTSAVVWRPQIEGLAAVYRIYAPDVVGFTGRSATTRLPYSGDAFARWAIDVLDALEVTAAHVVGGSAGGHFALKLATYAPQRVRSLALLNPCGLSRYRLPFDLARWSFIASLGNALTPRLASFALAESLVRHGTAATLSPHAASVEFSYLLLRHYRRYRPPGPLTSTELRQIRAPVRVLLGADEPYLRTDLLRRRVARDLPQTRIETLADAGHDLGQDQPEQVNARLRAFWAETEAEGESHAGRFILDATGAGGSG